MREIRTLRAMWRGLETGPRHLLNGHEEETSDTSQGGSLRAAAPVPDPTGFRGRRIEAAIQQHLDARVSKRARAGPAHYRRRSNFLHADRIPAIEGGGLIGLCPILPVQVVQNTPPALPAPAPTCPTLSQLYHCRQRVKSVRGS